MNINMKRTIILALCALTAAVFAGCGFGSPVAGKWEWSPQIIKAVEVFGDDEITKMYMDAEIEFKSGGEFVSVAFGVETIGKYTVKGDIVTIVEDGVSFVFRLDGDTLIDEDGDVMFVRKKQPAGQP